MKSFGPLAWFPAEGPAAHHRDLADASSCPAADQQFIADMTAVGIDQDPVHQSQGGLISGARNTVCVDALGGVKQVVDDVIGVVGVRHDEFVIDIDDRRGDSGT